MSKRAASEVDGGSSSAADIAAANKRGRMAGKAAVAAAKSRGVEIINHGAGTMPVDAPAPYDGTRYTLLEDPADAAKPSMVAPHDGIKGADGRLHFADAPDFLPTLTPAECIRKGVFGGCYFNPKGGKPGIFGREVNVSHQEFPSAWFKDLPETLYLSRRYNVSTNCYKVKSGFGQREWESKGWIHVQVPCACLSLLTLCPAELIVPHSHASIRFTLDDVFSRVAVLFCFFDRIRVDGFNGTAASSAAAARTTTNARSSVGPPAPRLVEGGGISSVVQLPRLQSMLMMLPSAQ